MQFLKYSFLLSVFILIFSACGKDNDGGGGANTPTTVVFTKPAANATIINGTNLAIEGNITDNNVLSSAKVEIRNKTTSAILYTATSNTGNVSSYSFVWNWTVTGITTNTTVTIKVTGKDSGGGEGFKEIDVNLVP